jgi:putative transposase
LSAYVYQPVFSLVEADSPPADADRFGFAWDIAMAIRRTHLYRGRGQKLSFDEKLSLARTILEDERRLAFARQHVRHDRNPSEIRGFAGGRFIKGKSAIHLARVYGERKRNFVGQHFWARGYFVSTVERDEEVIWEYIRNQENEDERREQFSMWN